MKEEIIKNVILTNFNIEYTEYNIDYESLKDCLLQLKEKSYLLGVLYGEFNYDSKKFDITLNKVTHHIENIMYHEYDRCIRGHIRILNINNKMSPILLENNKDKLVNEFKMRYDSHVENGVLYFDKIYTWDLI